MVIGDSSLEHIGNSPESDHIGLSFAREAVRLSASVPIGPIVVAERLFRVPRMADIPAQKRGVRIKSKVANDSRRA
jgi:hypothetical protein